MGTPMFNKDSKIKLATEDEWDDESLMRASRDTINM